MPELWPARPVIHDHEKQYGTPRPIEWEFSRDNEGPHLRRCGYCSSLHPEDLLKVLTAEQKPLLDLADMKYGYPHKIYLEIPKPGALIVPIGTPEVLAKYGENVPWFLRHYDEAWRHKFYFKHLKELPVQSFGLLADEIEKVLGIRFKQEGQGDLHWAKVGPDLRKI